MGRRVPRPLREEQEQAAAENNGHFGAAVHVSGNVQHSESANSAAKGLEERSRICLENRQELQNSPAN